MSSSRIATRIHAAPLTGRGWLGTGGRELSLGELRGKFVLLDFWTFCCVNCLHVLDELRELEERYHDVLVIVGVHSPKFAHEADRDALVAAVSRYGVTHPVLDDPTLSTWNAYAARAWPTLVLVDPDGYIAAQMSGEGHAAGLDRLLQELVPEHEAAGTLHRGDGPYVPPAPAPGALQFPGKLIALPSGGVLVSDTAHHQIVELDTDLAGERRRFGSGVRGLVDGPAAECAFNEPQGLAILPTDVAQKVGYDVILADSVNHALRGLCLADGTVRTVAGTGEQLRERSGAGPALLQALSSPWDVAWFDGALFVAMAGIHQIWRFDPVAETIMVAAGTSAEGLLDGDGVTAHFAQPSGVAASADGATLWIADSETSALRHIRVPDDASNNAANGASNKGPRRYRVDTDTGQGLFTFGHVDGPAATALMQHPLGVTELPDGSVAVCDTYNGSIRRFDPETREMSTLSDGLDEPSDCIVDTAGDEPNLIVVESAAHRLTRVAIPRTAQQVHGETVTLTREPTPINNRETLLHIEFEPPTGQKLDGRFGDPTRLTVTSSPPELLASGSGNAEGLTRALRFAPDIDGGILHISVQAAACDGDPVTGEVPEFAACHLYQQDWGIPVELTSNGPTELILPLRSV
ncbi:MAG: NHL domain-containing thioredoxin family protein [Nakamurella sp.]